MTIDNQIIRNIEEQYFYSKKMPEDLSLYLFDRYSEEPVEGEITEQFFYPRVYSDVRNYIKGELDTTLRTDLEKLQDRYDELSDILSGIVDSEKSYAAEQVYLRDFIRWLGQSEKYEYFRKNAHLEVDEAEAHLPFNTYYVL